MTAPDPASEIASDPPARPAPTEPPARLRHPSPAELLDHFERVVVGKREVLSILLAAMIADGHALIEDVPGVAKTIAARTLARSFSLAFGRVQLTPDLLPADLTGVGVWDERRRDFVFRPGPIFAQVLLADELNRATPRTQAGLLEAMEERAVTVDGVRHALPAPFFVIATQNPVEQSGVFPLPEAQLDRFLVQVRMGYPAADEEAAIVRAQSRRHPVEDVEPILDLAGLHALRERAAEVHVSDAVLDYATRVVRATRARSEVAVGASPRASIAIFRVARALAFLDGEAFARPDHVKRAAWPVLRHRLILSPQARLAGTVPDEVIEAVLANVETPIHDGAPRESPKASRR